MNFLPFPPRVQPSRPKQRREREKAIPGETKKKRKKEFEHKLQSFSPFLIFPKPCANYLPKKKNILKKYMSFYQAGWAASAIFSNINEEYVGKCMYFPIKIGTKVTRR